MAGDNDNSSPELKQLVQKRGQAKAKLSRFKTFLDSISETTSVTELKLRLARLEGVLAEFEEIQSQIEVIDPSDSQEEERECFEALYYKLAAQGEDSVQSRIPRPAIASTPSNDPSTTSSNGQVQVKLPSIDLPSFSGQYEDWLSFSETFNALIHTNESLNNVQRFHYLRSSLKGDAAELIRSLELIASNYSVAWSLLEGRYKNKRVIIQRHVKCLFELPSVDKEATHSIRHLLDGALKHIRALAALGQPTDSWDTMLLHLITSKLNFSLLREWELSTEPDQLPTFKNLTEFLERRCQSLENANGRVSQKHTSMSTMKTRPAQRSCLLVQSSNCRLCNGNHPIYKCQDLLKRPPGDRQHMLRKAGVCFNCLKPGHKLAECSSRGCRICNKKHNTALHSAEFANSQETSLKEVPVGATNVHTREKKSEALSAHTAANHQNTHQVLLSTALVDLVSPTGKQLRCRALLDNGSQSCFMTENVCQTLGLRKTKNACQVIGVNNIPISMSGMTTSLVKSFVTSYKTNLSFMVVPKITNDLPREQVNVEGFKIPGHITLADPGFASPGRIDLLIGQEIFFDIICIGQLKSKGYPTLQKTRLGWVVGGKLERGINQISVNQTCLLTTAERLSSQLQRFWNIEELPVKKHLTSEELKCEEDYEENTYREDSGRYNVRMPLRSDAKELGDSREIAEKRFLQMERRLKRDPPLKRAYSNFMKEYEQLNHMTSANATEDKNNPQYFLPHHPVIKTSSSTTKLRVVFDASARTTSGMSLNDIQLVGPTIQSDIFSVMLRFRLHTFVMTADIEKMFRQISINSSQRDLLQILWREEPNQPLQTFKMNTVTYGTASASYLATRTLNQLAEDEGGDFPEASVVIKRDFYMDDLITGSDSLHEALKLQNHLMSILQRGGFKLRKWNSNTGRLLEHLDPSLCAHSPQEFPNDAENTVKTLGMWWDAKHDALRFKYSPLEGRHPNQLTKRVLLSEIARLFDPLGLLAPIVIRAKVQIQELWKLQLSWDEALPMYLHTQWKQFLNCLSELNDLAITRQVTLPLAEGKYEIVGFSDASEKAYGGAVYLIHRNSKGKTKSSLICAKSRVTPLKTTSIPRLELCGALLVTDLINQVKMSLPLTICATTYLTDSTVVLAWINATPSRWNTFVANRVAKIQTLTASGEWRHVRTDENPADLISRGSKAKLLASSKLWWEGPAWLRKEKTAWPNTLPILKDPPEEKPIKICSFALTKNSNDIMETLLKRKSSFQKICRILALCVRYVRNLKCKSTNAPLQNEPPSQIDIKHARDLVLRFVQEQCFSQELKELGVGDASRTVPVSGRFMALAPFVGRDGLLRVGGRLSSSSLNYDCQHPILLPKNHILTDMIAREEHMRQLHCGPQALLYAIRQQYWPINGRSLTKRITHNCIKCARAKPKQMQQQMGNLPPQRSNPARAFLNTGVDYCGPFHVRPSRRRGLKPSKAYVAVFVCLATKAVHLELVGDLTTECFLGALKRFTARRGICAEIHSDNGTTFVGAKRQLQELYNFFEKEAPAISKAAIQDGIKWSFIPPYAPHMGGLWEAAVKSLKHHLRRIVGSAALTFEDLSTVLAQIEAVLNSRPITPMSNDPSDLTALTPAHFLTGGSLTALPEPLLLKIPEGRLSRWQRLQRLLQHFWSRWSREYLNNLQQRGKWKRQHPSPHIGALVLLKDDSLPPLSWPMGRIVHLHPGRDGLVRVVTVKTAAGEVKRSINKLCLLPMEQ